MKRSYEKRKMFQMERSYGKRNEGIKEEWNMGISSQSQKKKWYSKWCFSTEYKDDSSIDRYQARLVAKGFTQTHGIAYPKTLTPVAKMNSIRVLIAYAVNLGRNLEQLDVANAFLYGDLKRRFAWIYHLVSPLKTQEERFESSKGHCMA